MLETFTYNTTPAAVITEKALEQCPEGFKIECRETSDDFESIQSAVNQGIDSHLEAVRVTECEGHHGKRGFVLRPKNPHAVVR